MAVDCNGSKKDCHVWMWLTVFTNSTPPCTRWSIFGKNTWQVTVWYRMSPFCQTGGLFANRALNLAWPKRCFAMINFDAGSSQEIVSWTGAAGRSLWSRPWRICRRRRPANEGFEISHRISSPLILAGWDQQKEAAADTVATPVCQPPATLLEKVYAFWTLRRDVPFVIRLLTILGLELSKPTKLSGIGFSIKFCLFLGTPDFDPRKFGLLLYTWERIFPLPGASFVFFLLGGSLLYGKRNHLKFVCWKASSASHVATKSIMSTCFNDLYF